MDFPLKIDNTHSLNQVFTPVNIAILASLGLHAFVLGLALPYLAWPEPTEEGFEDRAPVGVIELTPAEQIRLPNTDPLPTNPLLPALPGETPPSLPTEPNLPTAPDSNYNYQLPDSSSLPPLPTMPSLPNLPAYPNLPPLTNYGNLSRLPITNPPLPSLPPLPSRRWARLPDASNSRFPDNNSALPPISPNDATRPRFAPLPPPQGTDFITRAPQGQNGANGFNSPVAPPELTAEGEDSSPNQVTENSLTSIAKQGVAIKSRDVIAGAYPAIACRNRTEAAVTYNVFPSGQKDLVGRSRYPIFNDLAAKAIAGRSYAQPTQVTVSFQYDPKTCAGVGEFGAPLQPQTPQRPPNLPPLGTPSTPTTATPPAQTDPPAPAGETPRPTSPRPFSTPSPTSPRQPSVTSPAIQTPSPQPSTIPDAPVPQAPPSVPVSPQVTPSVPPATPPTSEAQPPNTPVGPPTPSGVASPPAAPAPKQSEPKSQGEILREQNQAPFVPPSPRPNVESSSSSSN